VAAGFGVGWIPRRLWGSDDGAGTFGAAVGGIIGAMLWLAPWGAGLAVAIAAMGVSVWASAPEARSGADPGWIVIDEVAGSLVAVVGLGGVAWFVAWGVARLADIYKVLPGVARAEAAPAPLGITADDVVAGLYGLAAGWLVVWFT
jgi:phosphatidylglycerophosphatase A